MILRKPYAFIIRHFRLIHLLMCLLVAYITFSIYKISSFLTGYINTGMFNYENDLVNKLVSNFLYGSCIFVILLSLVIIALFRWKKIDYKYYTILISYQIVIIVGLVLMKLFLDVAINEIVDIRVLKAYRDITRIVMLPGFYFLISNLISAIGFNLKKFDFSSDLKALNASTEDSEEFEFIVGKDTYKYKRAFNRFIRETTYYIKENKILFFTMTTVFAIAIGLTLYFTLYVSKNQYQINETFLANGVAYTVKESYLTTLDYRGKIIDKDKIYLVVNTNINNTSYESVELNYSNYRLVLDNGTTIYPITSKGSYFIDLGDPFIPNVLPSKTDYDYMIIFELPYSEYNGSYLYRIVNEIDILKGEITAAYNDTIIKPKIIESASSNEVFTLNMPAYFNGSALKDSNLTISSFEIGDSFKENYKHCQSSKCYEAVETVKANNISNGSKTLIKFKIDYYIDNESFTYVKVKNSKSLFSEFGTITYSINDVKKTVNYKEVTPKFLTDDTIYIEVPSEVKNARELQLNLTVRDIIYSFILTN